MKLKIFNDLQFFRIKNKIRQIKLIVFDVDGVLTDGSIWVDSSGYQIKKFNVKDGLGIKLLQAAGIKIVFMSGGKGGSTEQRAKDLSVDYCLVGIKNKLKALKDLQEKIGFNFSETLYLGDDLNDLPVKKYVSIFISPRNASNLVKKNSNAVLFNNGGEGAVRELSERILKYQKKFYKLTKSGWFDTN